jgi:hypothetical protein
LDELGDAILAGDDEGEGVVAVVGVESRGALEVLHGGGEILVVDLFRAFKISVVGLAKLFGGDGRRGRLGCGRR